MSRCKNQSITFGFHSTMMVGWGWGILRSWGMVCSCWGMVARCRGMVGRLRSMVRHLIKVSLTLVGDIRHVAVVVVSMVGDMLGPTIRQSHRVGTLNVAGTIRVLPCVEVCPRVVVVHSILKTVRLGLIRVDRRSRGMIGRCRGVVGRCRSRSRGVVNRCRVVVRGVPSLSEDCWQKSSNCDESLQDSIFVVEICTKLGFLIFFLSFQILILILLIFF